MLDYIYKKYKMRTSIWRILLRNIPKGKWRNLTFIVSAILGAATIVLVIVSLIYGMLFIMGILITVVIYFAYLLFVKSKIVGNDIFRVEKENFFSEDLSKIGIESKEELEFLRNLIHKTANDVKPISIINWGVLYALLTAIFINCLTFIYNNFVESFDEALLITIYSTITIVCIFMLFQIYKLFSNEIFLSSYRRYKQLERDLELFELQQMIKNRKKDNCFIKDELHQK
ncbi:hypothetical protein ACE1TF_03660 [Geomicrobium sp. JSM 1781026]|uniref:hypothetical protein n=1 Tax=Geomicrobium sp. JSM 1781026 TaxID=3344580 RepID=UPI0035C1D218